MTRLVQLSDTHLSHVRGFFVENFQRITAHLRADPPDLIVVSGDLSLNGADSDDDLAFTKHLFDQLPSETLLIPGNHDVGEEPGAAHTNQPATGERLARYLRRVGADHFMRDIPGWRLFGLNAHLFGTGWNAEAAQWAWLARGLEAAGDRSVGVFLHKPLFISDPDEATDQSVCAPRAARDRLLSLAAAHRIRFFASGHLHQGRQLDRNGVRHVWAPSTAFPATEPRAPDSDTRLGFADFELSGKGAVASKIIPLETLEHHDYRAIKGHGKYAFLSDVPPRPSAIAWPL